VLFVSNSVVVVILGVRHKQVFFAQINSQFSAHQRS
jgi:hypothetical protein